jgi:hypothetical protein
MFSDFFKLLNFKLYNQKKESYSQHSNFIYNYTVYLLTYSMEQSPS